MNFRFWLRRVIFPGLCLALTVFRATAQRTDYSQENRFLIIIETSSGMRKCSNAVTQVITELFQTDMKGELRPHDTIGVWTYNDALHMEFPMQVWRETNSARIQRNIMMYMGDEHFERRGHLDKVMPVAGKVMGQSERMTVIFVYDGAEEIKGTPFDSDINALQKQFAHEFRSKHVPFVTTLVERDGRIFDYTVSTPGAIKLPHTALPWPPPPPPPAVAVAPAPIAPTPLPPHKYAEIVMSGAPAHSALILPVAPVVTNEVPAPAMSDTVASAPVAAPPVAASDTPQTNAVAEVTNPLTNTPVAAVVPTPMPAANVTPNAWPQPAAVGPAPRTSGEDAALYVIAFSLLAIAAALVWFLVRRARGPGAASLISQSMDRSR